MSDKRDPFKFHFLFPVMVWMFIAVKLAGTSLAAWSWWWLLFPPVPVLSLLVTRWGL